MNEQASRAGAAEAEAEDPSAGKWTRRVKELVRFLALVGLLLAARGSLIDHYTVPSESMEPTIQIGDRILVNKLAYGLRIPLTYTYIASHTGPARGDVVILGSPVDGRTLVKRVVGVPGDELSVRGGHIFLAGQPIADQPAPGQAKDERLEQLGEHLHLVRYGPGGKNWGPKKLPEDHYLVMGDNRSNSLDGRYFGLVPSGSIVGKAERVYWRDGGFSWVDL